MTSIPYEAAKAHQEGLDHLARGHFLDAAGELEKAAHLAPRDQSILLDLGTAFEGAGYLDQAVATYKRAAASAPDQADPHARIGELMLRHGRYSEAEQELAAAVERERSAKRFALLAKAQKWAGKRREASAALDSALEIDPASEEALEMRGTMLQEDGRFEAAFSHFEQARKADPSNSAPYFGMAYCREITGDDEALLKSILDALHRQGNTAEDLRKLHYAAGKAMDDLGRYEEAFGHFDQANRYAEQVQMGLNLPSVNAWGAETQATIDAFRHEVFAAHPASGSPSEAPIFIVGMIRSGTTLVEQIVSSHPQIAAGGEQPFWLGQAAKLALRPIVQRQWDEAGLQALASSYSQVLREVAPDASRVTDKQPINYLRLGLIHLAFPNARIIHCRRDPADTCVSIYTTPFMGSNFAYDKKRIVAFYREYLRFMRHWGSTIPSNRMMEVDYEDLVSDREPLTRRLIEFIGVEWDDACLEHFRNQRAVTTPSLWQVRQPTYRTSVERWRNYEPWIQEFLELRASASDSRD